MKLTKTILLLAALTLGPAALAGEPSSPTDAERARWTMGDMQSWSICFSAYAKDHKAFPVASTLSEIAGAFQPVYIRLLPLRDAWGTEYRVISDGTHFRLISAGADRRFDESTWSAKARNLNYAEDAVMSDDPAAGRTWKFE